MKVAAPQSRDRPFPTRGNLSYAMIDEATGRRVISGGVGYPFLAGTAPEESGLKAGQVSIDFDFGEGAEALAAEVRAFFEKTLTPELRAKAHYSFDGHDPGVHRKLAEAGLLFPSWPKEFGGRGATPYESSLSRGVWEEFGWTGHAAGTTQMVGAIIRRFGSDDLKREVLDRIVRGEAICSLGFSASTTISYTPAGQ